MNLKCSMQHLIKFYDTGIINHFLFRYEFPFSLRVCFLLCVTVKYIYLYLISFFTCVLSQRYITSSLLLILLSLMCIRLSDVIKFKSCMVCQCMVLCRQVCTFRIKQALTVLYHVTVCQQEEGIRSVMEQPEK